MKRSLVIIGLLLVLVLGFAYAENSAYYPVRLTIVKVFSHADGYQVVYRKGGFDTAVLYIPMKWFVPGGKAELVKANDPSYPYLVAFFKDGKFDHVRLYVQSNLRDSTWGSMDPSAGLGKFDNTDLKIEF